MTLTRRQWQTWQELNYWWAMLVAAEDEHYWRKPGGLCELSCDLNVVLLPDRAFRYRPRNSIYWWTPHDWSPRRAFIRRMIRLCEAELRGTKL